MNHADSRDMLRAAEPAADGDVWEDLGAGTGVFTRTCQSTEGSKAFI
jgi:hypothetical protein